MSNEDRIRKWRAAREAAAAAPQQAAASLADTMARLVGPTMAPLEDVLAMLIAALHDPARRTIPERRRIYETVEAAQAQAIELSSPDIETAEAHRRQLRLIVRLLEADIRAGVDVTAPGYGPAGATEANARLVSGHARRIQQRQAEDARQARRRASRRDEALAIPLEPDEAADLAMLRQRLSNMHAAARTPLPHRGQSWTRTIVPLLILQLQVIHAESRVALIWALVAPAVLLTLISSLYFIAGSHNILDMDVPTFSMLGATTWIMFRQIIFRSSSAYISSRALINLEAVSPLILALVQSFIYAMIYTVVYAILITAGYQAGLITLPASWAGFAFYVAMMAVAGSMVGLIFGGIATIWPYFLRFASVIERALELFSSVFFVSEQMPEQYRGYFLWSPLAHGMQLLRSAYFAGYHTADGKPAYFLTSIVFLAGIAFLVDRRVRSNIQPM